MNRETYRKAFDTLHFSEDFQSRTAALLADRARELNKEEPNMLTRNRKLAVLIAAAVALLAVSVSAAMLLLTPSQVAEHMEEPVLAAAFDSEDAVVLDEVRQTGPYTITLAGMVTGEGLSAFPGEYNGDVFDDQTYAVFTVALTDGTPLTDQPDLTYSPLVGGYPVGVVNGWTLGAGYRSFVRDGTAYYLFETRNLEMFADHPVYFAIYEGSIPSPALFDQGEDGTLALKEDVTGALFTLPLDESGADAAAVEAFLESTGMDITGGAEDGGAPEETPAAQLQGDTPESWTIEIP